MGNCCRRASRPKESEYIVPIPADAERRQRRMDRELHSIILYARQKEAERLANEEKRTSDEPNEQDE